MGRLATIVNAVKLYQWNTATDLRGHKVGLRASPRSHQVEDTWETPGLCNDQGGLIPPQIWKERRFPYQGQRTTEVTGLVMTCSLISTSCHHRGSTLGKWYEFMWITTTSPSESVEVLRPFEEIPLCTERSSRWINLFNVKPRISSEITAKKLLCDRLNKMCLNLIV